MPDSGRTQIVKLLMRESAEALKARGIDSPMRDVRLLMADALGIQSDRLTLHLEDVVDENAEERFSNHLNARLCRVPVSRILGHRLFYGRKFNNSQYVLDPRPETEILIDLALQKPFKRCLDVGTGSGCIAISLVAETPGAFAVASDVSKDALGTARLNAERHSVEERITFVRSNWFEEIKGQFDLIVSNPPYIRPDELAALAPEVALYDPELALTDNIDGLTGYRRLAAGASEHLEEGGRLLVEIGPTQARDVLELFSKRGLENLEVHPDLDGRDRAVSAVKSRSNHENAQ